MTRAPIDSTEIAQRIIALLGGDRGLTSIGARRIEALADGLVFSFDENGFTAAIVVIREINRLHYRLYIAHLGNWIEARQAHDVPAAEVREKLLKLMGKRETV